MASGLGRAFVLVALSTPAFAATSVRPHAVVLSDLHLGEGHDSPLEDFTVDDAFSDFVDHLIREGAASGKPATVVFNGDTIDFLKVSSGPDVDAARDVTTTEAVAVQKMKRVLKAHPKVFAAMARLVERGHTLMFLGGNHDQELSYARVRRVMREHIRKLAGAKSGRAIRFNPQFHLVGDVLVEHGQRYEGANAVHDLGWPFHGEGQDRKIRPAASSYLVVEAANPLRKQLPDITGMKRGLPQLLAALRGAPGFIPNWLGLSVRMSMRVGRDAPEVEARIARKHEQILRGQIRLNNMRAQVNETRRKNGQPPLTTSDLRKLLAEWDHLGAEPFLRGSPPVQGAIASAFRAVKDSTRLLRPHYLNMWLHPERGSTLAEAQDFALKHFANVVVNGHTHKPGHEQVGENKQLANSGTWTPRSSETGGPPDRTGQLTYVEITPRKVRLRRWDVEAKRPARPTRTWPLRAARQLAR